MKALRLSHQPSQGQTLHITWNLSLRELFRVKELLNIVAAHTQSAQRMAVLIKLKTQLNWHVSLG